LNGKHDNKRGYRQYCLKVPLGKQIFLLAIATANGNTVDADMYIYQGGQWGDVYDPELVVE
jgi:hypothetical protein